jgi:RNA polymerase sigma-70 factor (ECF subfamily)
MGNVLSTASDDTSLTLLGLAKGRDPAAWRRLVQLYSPAVFSWAKRAGLTDENAADIVQDVWTAVAPGLEKFRRDKATGTFRGWLWTITRNKVRDAARRRHDSAVAAGGTNAQMALNNVPETEPADDTDADAPGMVERALDLIRGDFAEHTWQAFWRTVVLGQPARDVAGDLGMAANAVHQAKFRILKRLRQELTALGVVDDPSFAGILPPA